jgi:hypothetical protein
LGFPYGKQCKESVRTGLVPPATVYSYEGIANPTQNPQSRLLTPKAFIVSEKLT